MSSQSGCAPSVLIVSLPLKPYAIRKSSLLKGCAGFEDGFEGTSVKLADDVSGTLLLSGADDDSGTALLLTTGADELGSGTTEEAEAGAEETASETTEDGTALLADSLGIAEDTSGTADEALMGADELGSGTDEEATRQEVTIDVGKEKQRAS